MTDLTYQRLTLDCGHIREAHTTLRNPDPYEVGEDFICTECKVPRGQITKPKTIATVETLDPFEVVRITSVSPELEVVKYRNGNRKVVSGNNLGAIGIFFTPEEWQKVIRL